MRLVHTVFSNKERVARNKRLAAECPQPRADKPTVEAVPQLTRTLAIGKASRVDPSLYLSDGCTCHGSKADTIFVQPRVSQSAGTYLRK